MCNLKSNTWNGAEHSANVVRQYNRPGYWEGALWTFLAKSEQFSTALRAAAAAAAAAAGVVAVVWNRNEAVQKVQPTPTRPDAGPTNDTPTAASIYKVGHFFPRLCFTPQSFNY
jgi:hypothetical protein